MPIQLNFTDGRTGLFVRNAIWVPEIVSFKSGKILLMNILVQESEANRGKEPLRQYRHYVPAADSDFDTYFALTALNPLNKNIFANIDTYLNTELDGTQEGETNGIDFTAGTIVS